MTDFKDEKPMPRQPRLSPQNEQFDFDLADMRVLPDHDTPAPSPLDHVSDNEDAIDRVLLDANFPPSQSNTATNLFSNNDETLLPPKVPEIKTSFYVDYFDKRKKTKKAPTPVIKSEPTVTPEPMVQAESETRVQNKPEPIVQTMYTENETSAVESPTESVAENEQAPVFNSSGMAFAILSQFKSRQESINKQQEKLIQDFSKRIKKATTITYTATFFGLAALATAAALGVMLFKAENKLTQLESSTTALKDNIRNINSLPDDMKEGTDPSLDQIHQKIDEVEERLGDMAELQNKVALLEKNISTNIARQSTVLATNQTTTLSKEVVHEPNKPEVKTTQTKPITKTTTSTKPSATTPTATVTKPQIATTTKPTKSNAKKDDMDKAIDVPANDINKVTAHSRSQHTSNSQNQNTEQQTATKGWAVNLASSNRLDDAKRTAEKFAQKGIPVTISTATIKNKTYYRLQVRGFKNKEEANAFANKAKATLNLNSVWINP